MRRESTKLDYNSGYHVGYDAGYQQGLRQGIDAGYQQGYRRGWHRCLIYVGIVTGYLGLMWWAFL